MIKKYIQFAIDNGLIENHTSETSEFEIHGKYEFVIRFSSQKSWWVYSSDILDIEFIEAIARGVIRGTFSKNALEENIQHAFNHSIFTTRVNQITTDQAIAIRDDKLPEFITDLLK